MIYLDNAATMEPEPEVLETFTAAYREFWGNPHSLHRLGERAQNLLGQAHDQLVELLSAPGYRLVFTSGATEANNLAIKGALQSGAMHGRHVITTNSEHPSVAMATRWLEQQGVSVTYLPVSSAGTVSPDQVQAALQDTTVLVSTILVNNESGAIAPVGEIARVLAGHPARYHVDAVQAVGKLPLAIAEEGVDMVTLSAHKFGGLKGSGALLVRGRQALHAQIVGGGQQGGDRSGTVDVPKAAALAKALRLATSDMNRKLKSARDLNACLRSGLRAVEGVSINSPMSASPYILNISVSRLRPETVVHALAAESIFVSTVSACASQHADLSHVIYALTGSEERARTALRISCSSHTTHAEINQFLDAFARVLKQLR